MSDYSFEYAYRRGRRRKGGFFAVVFTAVFIGVILFAGNLLFGFINFGGKVKADVYLPELKAWALEIGTYTQKSNAIEAARTVKTKGGAGFVMACVDPDCELPDCWCVLENVYVSESDAEIALLGLDNNIKTNAKVRNVSVTESGAVLKDKKHTEIFNKIANSFNGNLILFNDYLKKFKNGSVTAAEVADAALTNFNALKELINQFDAIQENAMDLFYARLLLSSNKHLLALYLLSGEAKASGFESKLSNCLCRIFSAYRDLSAQQ